MRVLSLRIHALIDWVLAAVIAASPWVLRFGVDGEESWSAVGVGAVVLANALLMCHGHGVVKCIPPKFHLTIDVLAGVFLAASPWVFGFSGYVWGEHVALGLALALVGACTNPRPEGQRSMTSIFG